MIGETSNKSAELKKFVQTFVLAQQPTGYFVLNDIFRYINEEGEEEQVDAAVAQEESAPTGPLVEDVEMPKPQAAVEEPAPLNAEVVDEKLEETIEAEEVAAPATNGTPAEPTPEVEAPVEAKVEEVPTPEVTEKAIEEEVREPEIPKEPEPTPVITRQHSVVKPAQPAKPLSWAGRAAAAAAASSGPKPAIPAVPSKTATPPAQPRAAPQTALQAPKPTQTIAAPATPDTKENVSPTGAGWQSVGSDHAKRQNRPQSISSPPEKEGTMGYVRNVTEKVQENDLRTALASFGELIYFDINRGKVRIP